MGERFVGGDTGKFNFCLWCVALSLFTFYFFIHLFFFPPLQSLHPCVCWFLLLVHLHLSCLVNVALDKEKICSTEDLLLTAIIFFSSLQQLFSYVCQCSPILFPFPLVPPLPPSLRAESRFQSQGPCVSTPLTLREPCLCLSTTVCVCSPSVHAGLDHFV